MQIQNVQYIDKTSGSIISVYSDKTIIANYTTSVSYSNQLTNSGKIGNNTVLPMGHHTMKLQAIHTDKYGLKVHRLMATLTAPEIKLHFSCPYVSPDNGSRRPSILEITAIVSVILTTIGLITTCVFFCIKMYRKSKESKSNPTETKLLVNSGSDTQKNNRNCCCRFCPKRKK